MQQDHTIVLSIHNDTLEAKFAIKRNIREGSVSVANV